MSILGIGTDIVEVERIADVIARHGGSFGKRLFTPAELELAASRGNPVSFYAGRWAAKEACSKALGCGIGSQCSFTDIEILNDGSGRPQLTLSGAALETFKQLGASAIHISISHEHHYATATVIIQ